MLIILMFENIYILYLLSKYQIGIISKKDLIIGLREYIINKGQVFIKLIQLMLANQWKWKGSFTNEEFVEMNKILDNVYVDVPESDFRVGCGSVAFVYYNKSDNSKVIKKLLPDIENKINESFENFSSLLRMARFFNYDIINIENIDIYKEVILEQTDMVKEAKNMIKMRRNFINVKNVYIPKVFYYNKNMIEMRYMKGDTINNFLKKYPEREKDCYSLLKKSFIRMIDTKFIHGDLHDGNLLYYLDNEIVKLNIIDLGLILKINDIQQKIFYEFFIGKKIIYKIKFIYEISIKNVSFNDFNKFCNKPDVLIFFEKEKMDTNVLLKKIKEINMAIEPKYLNFLISLCSIRLKNMKFT